MGEIQLNQSEKAILEGLKDRLPALVVELSRSSGQLAMTVDKKDIVAVCRVLKEHRDMNFDYLADLCGVDYLGKREKRFQVVYNLYSIALNHRIRVKTDVSEEDCAVDSVTEIWKTANWHERELYDMFGIDVKGHPELERILMPEDWEGYPLRKDYPLRGKGQRNDFSFVPKHDRQPTREPEAKPDEW
ncbi:MAG: NADH-quinone oxidoreductase subunit C [bacterium]|nr:NADH-quinone oxidoreductase subunit C [bacterium]